MTIKIKSGDALKKMEQMNGGSLTIGKFIRAIRMGEEISQVAFAKILGVSKQQLCDIEHDRKPISPKMAAAYANKLGYSQEQFVRLALQSQVDAANLPVVVQIVAQTRTPRSGLRLHSTGAVSRTISTNQGRSQKDRAAAKLTNPVTK